MIIYCPNCNQKYDIDDSCINAEVECSECHFTFSAVPASVRPVFMLPEKEANQQHLVDDEKELLPKKIIATVLIVLAIAFFALGIIIANNIGEKYSAMWGWGVFFSSFFISANFMCWGVLLDSLHNIENLLSKKK